MRFLYSRPDEIQTKKALLVDCFAAAEWIHSFTGRQDLTSYGYFTRLLNLDTWLGNSARLPGTIVRQKYLTGYRWYYYDEHNTWRLLDTDEVLRPDTAELDTHSWVPAAGLNLAAIQVTNSFTLQRTGGSGKQGVSRIWQPPSVVTGLLLPYKRHIM